MTAVVLVPHPHVMMHPQVFGGSPYVRQSRVLVRRLYSAYLAGCPIEKLCRRYPQLKPAQIFDALSFAIDNQDVIAADITRAEAR